MSSVSALPTSFSHIRLDRVGSTNDEARRLALSGAAADLLVVSAREQSAGRGRRGRVWDSPVGNLHCSVLIRLEGSVAVAAQLGFAAAAALVDAFQSLAPQATFKAKWPNDVLVSTPTQRFAKCSGMLLEPVNSDWLILGVGVDVVHAPAPDLVQYPACALAELGFQGDAMDVLGAFCHAFAPLLGQWRGKGFAPIRNAWLERARGVGEPVVVRLERETQTGIFAGLDGEGALLLDQCGEGTRRILAGDVYFPDAASVR